MTPSIRRRFVAAGHRALRVPAVGASAVRWGASRRHRLAMVFHRITPGPAIPGGIVTRVAAPMFREQVEALMDLGDVVPLTSLLEPASGDRPRFALTFDDDAITHHDVVLPMLSDLGVTATFFLCGRSLHGLGPSWFEVLDALLLRHGVDHVARLLGTPPGTPDELSARCIRDPEMQNQLVEERIDVGGTLGREEIRVLAEAGMTIGFHTLHHALLPPLPEETIDAALVEGRSQLEAVVGQAVRTFAYPHGAADPRVAERVRRAGGYLSAWTGRQRPVVDGDDPYLLGRWEPGPLRAADFRARVAANLNGWAGA